MVLAGSVEVTIDGELSRPWGRARSWARVAVVDVPRTVRTRPEAERAVIARQEFERCSGRRWRRAVPDRHHQIAVWPRQGGLVMDQTWWMPQPGR
jgi:hypothetical protein